MAGHLLPLGPMCGFAVMLTCDGGSADPVALHRMISTLRHRGPDDEGVYVAASVGLGFRRLSILDLSPSGHQPMVSADGAQVLVFNGEIYNYLELREELRGLGHTFRSSGDTEVLLCAYQQWGAACLSKLNGMWAFVIFDRVRQVLFGSRDRFGVKPLYYHRARNHVLIASEIKGILASGYYRPATNWTVTSRFLLQGLLDEDEHTFYDSIDQVPAGSAFEINRSGEMKQWRFWSLDALPQAQIESPASAFEHLFRDAVRLRLRSDVPVGVCLSGGLDSTSIMSLAAGLRRAAKAGDRLQAFCYMSTDFDESPYINETIAQTGAELNRLEVDPVRLWDNLDRAIWHYDEPVHSPTALIGFELMKLAAGRGVKVVLNGQGSDETLAGYQIYFGRYWQTLLRQGKILECWREISAYAQAHAADARVLFRTAIARLLRSSVRRVPALQTLARQPMAGELKRRLWFLPEFVLGAPAHVEPGDDSLSTALRFAVERRKLPTYLRVEDRNSMAHSVEARVPFLDYRLVTLAHSLPANWKMRGPWNKYVLREAMRGHIPESVRTRRDKMGFPTSAKRWFREEWYGPIQDLLASQAVRERGIYRVNVIREDLERHRQGLVDISGRLFEVAQFEAWADARQMTVMPALAAGQ